MECNDGFVIGFAMGAVISFVATLLFGIALWMIVGRAQKPIEFDLPESERDDR